MASISVVISAYNAKETLARTLSSVKWADEVIVIDNESTDDTAQIAKRTGAKIIQKPNNRMLNVNKNFGFTKATSDWILSLDSDEEIPQDLAHEIQTITAEELAVTGYWIPRKNIIFGKWIRHGLWWPDKQLRLFKRGKGKFPCVHVHEYIQLDGESRELTHPYIHYNYRSVSQFIHKMDDIYTQSEVQKLEAAQYQLSWFDAVRFPASDFIKIYFAQGGYKDGLHGLVLSLLQAFYSLVVFAKLWEKTSFTEIDIAPWALEKELGRLGRETRYWIYSMHIAESKDFVSRFVHKVKRRLAGI